MQLGAPLDQGRWRFVVKGWVCAFWNSTPPFHARSFCMIHDTAKVRSGLSLWSLAIAFLLSACLSQGQAQVNSTEGLGLPNTLWHCSNDLIVLSPGTSPCLSAFSLALDGNNDRAQWNTNETNLLSGHQTKAVLF